MNGTVRTPPMINKSILTTPSHYLIKCWPRSMASIGHIELTHSGPGVHIRLGVSLLVQLNSCRLFVAKSLPKPILTPYQLEHWEQISKEFAYQYNKFPPRKYFWIVICKMATFSSSINVLAYWGQKKRGCHFSGRHFHVHFLQQMLVIVTRHRTLYTGSKGQ